MKRAMKLLSRRADHVIVVSYTSERFYREFCGCDKVTIIHNSPLPQLFPCEPKSAEALRTVTHNSFLSADRGMYQILEALAIVKQQVPLRFLNVGMIAEKENAAFAQRVKALNLEDEVEVTGWLDYDRVGPALNRGAIGLLALRPMPNNYATLHNKLFNYMCTGQAVIGPKGSDTEIVLKRADCGLAVDMTDPRELAQAILTLLRDPERTRRLGLNGRKAIETEFGWHMMEKSLESVYHELNDRNSARARSTARAAART
jgi:glycosyltransferase involved in cell wall biosynthesis